MKLVEELNRLPMTQAVRKAGATSGMLSKKKSTDSLRKGNKLEKMSNLPQSISGLYLDSMRNRKFSGILDFVKLRRTFKESFADFDQQINT